MRIKRRAEADVTYAVEEAIRAKVEAEVKEQLSQVGNAYHALSRENDLLLNERKLLNEQLVKVISEIDELKARDLDDIPF